jgi:hypothetical protein
VANLARAQHPDAQQHRVAVAVRPRCHDFQAIAGGFTFGPQSLSSAAVERDEAGSQGHLQRFAVHEAHHQQLPSGRILNYCRRQPLHFVEVDLHRK